MKPEPIDYRLKNPLGEWLAWIEICALYNINNLAAGEST